MEKMLQSLTERESDLVDEVAKDLFTKRLFNIRDMSDPEVVKVAIECYIKAINFIKARRERF